jgi:hypothetical protein
MPQTILTPVSRAGEYLEVHPTALANHKELGWAECERRETVAVEDPSGDAAASEPRKEHKGRGAKAADTNKPAPQEPSGDAAAEQPKE